MGAPMGIGWRLTNALAHTGQTELTVLLEDPVTLDVELVQEEEVEAGAEAERQRPGLTMFTDVSRQEDRATVMHWSGGTLPPGRASRTT